MKTFTFFFFETWHCLLLIWRSCGKSSPAKNNVTRPKLRLKISIATQIQLWRNLCPPFDTCEYCQRQRQSVERWLINLWQGNGINTDQILKGCETELRNWENIKNEKLSQTVFEGKKHIRDQNCCGCRPNEVLSQPFVLPDPLSQFSVHTKQNACPPYCRFFQPKNFIFRSNMNHSSQTNGPAAHVDLAKVKACEFGQKNPQMAFTNPRISRGDHLRLFQLSPDFGQELPLRNFTSQLSVKWLEK